MKNKLALTFTLICGLGLALWAAPKQQKIKEKTPVIPAHDCCHNGKCCGTQGCCDKTGCKSAKCPSIPKKDSQKKESAKEKKDVNK